MKLISRIGDHLCYWSRSKIKITESDLFTHKIEITENDLGLLGKDRWYSNSLALSRGQTIPKFWCLTLRTAPKRDPSRCKSNAFERIYDCSRAANCQERGAIFAGDDQFPLLRNLWIFILKPTTLIWSEYFNGVQSENEIKMRWSEDEHFPWMTQAILLGVYSFE